VNEVEALLIKTIRCSALPAAFDCPGSVRRPDVLIDPLNERAHQGSAAHEVMRAIVEMDARSIDGIELVEISRKWGADPEELKIQAFIGLQLWARVRDRFVDAQAEVPLSAPFDLGDGVIIELTGNLDALAVKRRIAALGDWKFGRIDKNHANQVKGYQALVLANYPEVEKVYGFVGWALGTEPGSGPDVEDYVMTRDGMWEWLELLKAEVLRWDGVYHPGEQCAFCARAYGCPAMVAMARRDVLVLGDPEMSVKIAGGLQDLDNLELISLYRRGRVLDKVMENVDKAVRARVDAAGGWLPDGEGRELRFIGQSKRRLDPEKARPVLETVLTKEEIVSVTELRASRIDELVADKTPRGHKKQAIEDLEKALQAAGAITEKKERRLMDVRSK
jgi:hypothetical protein